MLTGLVSKLMMVIADPTGLALALNEFLPRRKKNVWNGGLYHGYIIW